MSVKTARTSTTTYDEFTDIIALLKVAEGKLNRMKIAGMEARSVRRAIVQVTLSRSLHPANPANAGSTGGQKRVRRATRTKEGEG